MDARDWSNHVHVTMNHMLLWLCIVLPLCALMLRGSEAAPSSSDPGDLVYNSPADQRPIDWQRASQNASQGSALVYDTPAEARKISWTQWSTGRGSTSQPANPPSVAPPLPPTEAVVADAADAAAEEALPAQEVQESRNKRRTFLKVGNPEPSKWLPVKLSNLM